MTKCYSCGSITVSRASTRDSRPCLSVRYFSLLVSQTSQLEGLQARCSVCTLDDVRGNMRYISYIFTGSLYIVDCFKDCHTSMNYYFLLEPEMFSDKQIKIIFKNAASKVLKFKKKPGLKGLKTVR